MGSRNSCLQLPLSLRTRLQSPSYEWPTFLRAAVFGRRNEMIEASMELVQAEGQEKLRQESGCSDSVVNLAGWP